MTIDQKKFNSISRQLKKDFGKATSVILDQTIKCPTHIIQYENDKIGLSFNEDSISYTVLQTTPRSTINIPEFTLPNVFKAQTVSKEHAIKITESTICYNTLKPIYESLDTDSEHFVILFLNRNNIIMSYQVLSTGGTIGTIVDPKKLFKSALLAGAKGLILSHNHPSGNLSPSSADKNITQKINSASKLLEIAVLDHIIYTESDYFSFADHDLL